MIRSQQRQRPARIFYWVSGVLILVFCGITGYQLWVNRDRHDFDPERVEKAKKDPQVAIGWEEWEQRVRDGEARVEKERAEGMDPLPPLKITDWPQWRGPIRDGIYRDKILTDWPEGGLNELWSAPMDEGYSSLAIGRGRLVTMMKHGGEDAVVCFDAETGERKWHYAYGDHYHNGYGSGPRATPTLDGDYVYATGANCEMLCLKLTDGALVWRKDLKKEFGARDLKWGHGFSPLIEGDLVLTQPGGDDGNAIIAFDKRTGDVVWKTQSDRPAYSSPMITTAADVRQALFFMGEHLVSVDPKTGELYWRFEWKTESDCNIATPIVRGNYVYVSTNYSVGCALLEIEKDSDGKPQVKQVYRNNRMMNHFATSIYHDRHVYGFHNGYFRCMRFADGEMMWEAEGDRALKKGSLAAADGHLIIMGPKGNVTLVEATPEEYRKKARFQFSRNKCWTMPVIANGRLYLRDERALKCYDLRP